MGSGIGSRFVQAVQVSFWCLATMPTHALLGNAWAAWISVGREQLQEEEIWGP